MNNMIKTYTISVSGINWDIDEDYDDTCGDWGLPNNGIFEVESSHDPYEKWNEEGTISGYELFCEEVVDALTEEYGFCIESIDDIEVINEIKGTGKQI